MPTRRGSIQLGGAPAPVEDSAMRAVDVGAAVEGRDSFGEEDDDEVPVKVLASDFDSAAMAPPPPRAPAPAREESLQVFCRLRPLARGEQGGVVDVMDPHTIRSAPPAATQRHASHHVRREARDYTFARVFDAAATQNEVYERTTAPLVDGLFGGRSALLFTYGVTNAGKSYTMMGSPEDNDTAGLLPRSLGAILARAEDQRCEVRLSFLEIYNEHVYDLMAPTGRWAKRRALRVKDVTTRIEVANLTSTRVTSAAHGLELCRAAQSQRKTSKTGLNQTSSRSHAICSLEVRNAAGASTQLMLVDLAGSERGDRTGAAVGGDNVTLSTWEVMPFDVIPSKYINNVKLRLSADNAAGATGLCTDGWPEDKPLPKAIPAKSADGAAQLAAEEKRKAELRAKQKEGSFAAKNPLLAKQLKKTGK